MAQLKDSIVSGNLRVTDTTLTDTLQVTTIKAPTSSGGTTYGPGTSGQVLKSNGTMTYWADMPTIPSNNVTGSGTSGYLTKWNGTNTITNGPQLGSSTTTFLRNDGSWATPPDTDTKVNVKLATTSQAYLLGTTTIPTAADTGVTSVADTGVYLTTTAGELCATKFMTSGKNGGYYTHDADNAKFPLVYNNATNLWVGAEGSTSYPHKGETFISTGWLGTLPTTSGETLTGNSTIKISVPKYTAGSSGGTWGHTAYYVLHTGNTSVTTTGSGNAITALSFSNGTFTATKGSTFSLSTHTHDDRYLGAVKIGSYYGMADPDGTDTHWIRTSTLGIIPATSVSLANGGDGSLGTSVWAFKDAYVANINGVAVGSSPKFTDANVLQSNTATTDYRPILFGKTQTTTIADLSATVTGQAYVSSKMFAKPDTGKLYASEFITSGYINGAGSDLTQYGLYLRSYKTESLPAGGDYDYSRYAVRTYGGKSGDNSGMLLEMGGGGLTIVGAGESASSLAALISDDQRDSNTSRTRLDVGGTLNTSLNGSSEQLILSSDNNIYFLTACNTITGRKPVCLDTSSYFYPGTNKTGSIGTSSYMWNSVYAATIYENGTSLASKYAAVGHTHSTTIATDSGTNQLTLAASTKYKLTAGETNFIFTTPPNTTYTFATGDAVGQFKVTSGGSAANYNINGIAAGTASGTVNHLAYYSAATTIGSSANIIYSVEDSSASTPRSRTILHLVGNQTVGNEATQLVGGVKGVLSYGDGGPQINFSTSATIGGAQDSSIIWTDNNSAAYGASWHFVSKETDWNVISKRFHARTGISIGTEVPPVINSTTAASNTDSLYVVGTSQFNGTTTITTSDFGTQLIVERSGNPYYASVGFKNSLGMLSYIGANAVDANLYHIYAGDTSKQYIILDTGNTSFTQSLSSGTKIGTIKIGGTSTDLYCQTNTNTDTKVKVTASTSKAYLMGTTTSPDGTAVEGVGNTGVYMTNGVLTASSVFGSGAESQSTAPTGGYRIYDCRNVNVSPNDGNKAVNFYFHMTDMPDTSLWWSVLHMRGWTGAYAAWEIAGPSDSKDQRTKPLYVRTSNTNTAWGSWRKIYDASNPPTASEVGALASTTKYAASSSVGGPATNVATTVTNGTENTARYGIAFVAGPGTSNAQAVLKNNDFRFNMSNGTDATGSIGHAEIVLGNNTPSSTAGNKNGILTLYSTGSYYGSLNNGTLTANRTHTLPDASGTIKLEKRSMMYDDTSDWASYSWHKFAEITSTTNHDDKAITFLVSRTYDTEYSGILSVHVRMNGSKNYQKHQFKWLIADENINPNNFVLVYTNNGTTSCKIELWYKQSQIYEGWIFEVLKEHTRMASENAWTVYTTSGHGSATYTAGTNHHASELACVQSKTALYAVKGTHTTTTNAWTGKIDANVLYDGMTIAYYLPYAVSPSANVTLNLTLSNGTTTGAINCYQNNTTRITTHYGAGSTIILTYWSAGSISVAGTATTDNRWTRCDYNSNSNVTQTNTTTDASYRVIFSGNANDTSETTTVRKSTNLQFNPSKATLSIGKAGTTQGSLVFNNSEGGHATLKSNSKGTSPTFLLPDTDDNLTHTLSTGMYDLSVTKGLMTISNVPNIPVHTMTFKIVFKSDGSTPIYSMIEIPNIDDGLDYGGLIQVGSYSDGQGSTRIIMKAVIVKITAGSTAGTKTFTATASPTQQVYGSSVSQYTRNVSIEKIYACT